MYHSVLMHYLHPPQLSSFAETLSPITVVFGDWVHWKLNRVR